MSIPVESIRELSQQISDDVLREQKTMMDNVEKLVIILHPPKAKKTYQDLEREADKYHSNTKPSQIRREALYKTQVQKAMLEKAMREKKERRRTSIYVLLQQQREYLALESRKDYARADELKKREEELFYYADEEAKQKLAQLLADIDGLSDGIDKVVDLLRKAILQLEEAMMQSNIKFMGNFEAIASADLKALGEEREGELYLTVDDKKIKYNENAVIEVFGNIIEKAFYDITQGKTVDINELRSESVVALKDYLAKQNGALSEDIVERAVNQLMSTWDKQSTVLGNHLKITSEMQSEITFYTTKCAEFQAMKQHTGDISRKFRTQSDITPKEIANTTECINEMKKIVNSINVNLVTRVGSTLSALENRVMDEQSKLNKPVKTAELEQAAQITTKPSSGGKAT